MVWALFVLVVAPELISRWLTRHVAELDSMHWQWKMAEQVQADAKGFYRFHPKRNLDEKAAHVKIRNRILGEARLAWIYRDMAREWPASLAIVVFPPAVLYGLLRGAPRSFDRWFGAFGTTMLLPKRSGPSRR